MAGPWYEFFSSSVFGKFWPSNMLSILNPMPTLPKYTDKVGTVECEIPLRSLGFESIPEELPASTVKFRIFYPARPNSGAICGIPWLPEPQDAYIAAYLKLFRLGPWLSKLLLSVPLYLRTTSIHAYKDAPLSDDNTGLPVVIFSHGLVSGINAHSALLGELASNGVVCIAVDHRDGSGLLSLARNEETKMTSNQPSKTTPIYFKNVSLKLKPGVLEARDKQLQIRFFELIATYQALLSMNNGDSLPNLTENAEILRIFPKSSLKLKAGEIIWIGHSFGGSTLVQFFKTIYHEARPSLATEDGSTPPENSLLLQQAPRSLVEQIKPFSPLVLLDPWFMPLRSSQTRRLFSKPLPCYDLTPDLAFGQSPTTVAILSSDFAWHWPEVYSHMPHIFAADPRVIKTQAEAETMAQFDIYSSREHFINESKRKYGNNRAADKSTKNGPGPTSTFILHDTTHVTLSDFGIMFPWLIWWFNGQKKPELATRTAVRFILDTAGLQRLQYGDPNAKMEVCKFSKF